jgi:hypothetical protein
VTRKHHCRKHVTDDTRKGRRSEFQPSIAKVFMRLNSHE